MISMPPGLIKAVTVTECRSAGKPRPAREPRRGRHIGSSALIVLALAISPTSALPKPVTLSYLHCVVEAKIAAVDTTLAGGRIEPPQLKQLRGPHTQSEGHTRIAHVTLSYSQKHTKEVMPVDINTTVLPERPGYSRRDWARVPILTSAQKQALVEAWRAGYHVGLPLTFAAIVYVESSACKHMMGDHGLAHGCSQIHQPTARAVSGVDIPAWQLQDPNLQDENMALGARYLHLCVRRFGWPAGIDCFNEGIPNASRMSKLQLAHARYTRAVLAAMKWLRQLPLSED